MTRQLLLRSAMVAVLMIFANKSNMSASLYTGDPSRTHLSEKANTVSDEKITSSTIPIDAADTVEDHGHDEHDGEDGHRLTFHFDRICGSKKRSFLKIVLAYLILLFVHVSIIIHHNYFIFFRLDEAGKTEIQIKASQSPAFNTCKKPSNIIPYKTFS